MARYRKAISKRRGPTQRIPEGTWKGHKLDLQKLYLERRLPLSEVMKIMKQKNNFDATPKQYRYCFQKWKWLKYGQKNSQSPSTQCHSPTDSMGTGALQLVEGSATSSEDSDDECDDSITSSSSESDDIVTVQNVTLLRQQFLSVFSEVCYPVPGSVRELIVTNLHDPMNSGNHPQDKQAAITIIAKALGLTDDSINVIAYHHLNCALGNLGQINQGWAETKDEKQEQLEDEPLISRFHVIEQQPWYQDFDENSPASQCILLCMHWIKQQLRDRRPREKALSYFDSLGNEAGSGFDAQKQDICLFVYLADALLDEWALQGTQSLEGHWDQLSNEVIGISSMEMLRTMSSLILGTPCLNAGPLLRRRSTRNIRHKDNASGMQLIDSALRSIEALENICRKELVLEFITEFVWIHDPIHQTDEEKSKFERKARKAAEAYADVKLSMSPEPTYLSLEHATSEGSTTLYDDSNMSIGG